MKSHDAVVLLSGGQDSTTVFYDALERYDRVHAIMFDYGQRHRIELDLATKTADKANVPWVVLPIEALKTLGAASLTNPGIRNTAAGAPAPDGWHSRMGLPPSFVPGRNILFFTLAAAYAIPKDITTIVTGVCQQDAAGYPDCRGDFVDRMELAIRAGMDTPTFDIDAPLLDKSKAETFQMADDLGRLHEILVETNTCYEGERNVPKPWGYGCGQCGACVERERGYYEFRKVQGERRHAQA